jgi:hypothetical protein
MVSGPEGEWRSGRLRERRVPVLKGMGVRRGMKEQAGSIDLAMAASAVVVSE